MSINLPQYPVYVISKGRSERCLTAKFLTNDKVPFYLVVEPQETEEYWKRYPGATVLTLPFSNLGLGGIPARNWCWEHSKANGFKRHWILDDNIYRVRRWYQKKKIPCNSGVAFKCSEDFVERYTNVAIAGLNYSTFAIPSGKGRPPFNLNCHVYSCLLILNELPNRWRGRYNEDTDLCLQVLADGFCTVLFNAFLIEKIATMTMKGGNSAQLYKGDGRLHMARSLERMWPGVVSVDRRFQRPQHVVENAWRRFDTQLIRRTDIDWSKFNAVDNYGMEVVRVKERSNDAD